MSSVDFYDVFTLLWSTLTMILAYVITGITIYKFDHESLLLIRPESEKITVRIRILTTVSLAFYCISLTCYLIATYDWIINTDNNQVYYDARIGMFVFYVIAYLLMFLVLISRLKQMSMFLHNEYKLYVYIILLILMLIGVCAFVIFYIIFHTTESGYNTSSSNHAIALLFAFIGFVTHFSLSIMIIYLFLNRLYQKIHSHQQIIILSSSTDNYRGYHQHNVMINMIKRYTSLSILMIFSTFCMLIPVLIYFTDYDNFHNDSFYEHTSWWIIAADQIINIICIFLYLPLSIRLYNKICCGMEFICNNCTIPIIKQRILQTMYNGRTSTSATASSEMH